MSKNPKICFVHDYLIQFGGAEKTLEALVEVFPDAPVYTLMHKPGRFEGPLSERKIISANKGVNNVLGLVPVFSKYFTFLMPMTVEGLDLSEFDIVITSSSSYAKGVLTRPEQLHISYIHTPPRFLYGYSVESTSRDFFIYRPVVKIVDHFLRVWDYTAAQRADYTIANSKETRRRVRKFYRRDAQVIYPPVDVEYDEDSLEKDSLQAPYYIAIGRLVAYKNFDFLVQAFNLTGMPLKIVGTGKEERKLKGIAKDNIEFTGRVTDAEKHRLLENSLGLIFPVVDEDFGIVPVEAFAHGKPVLAHRSGGVLETVRDGTDGMFFDDLNLEHFVQKLREFDTKVRNRGFNSQAIKNGAERFGGRKRFQNEFKEFVLEKWNSFSSDTEK